MNPDKRTQELRTHYLQNPPEGMTPEDIQSMSESDLLDMDYFLHELDEVEDEVGEEDFYFF